MKDNNKSSGVSALGVIQIVLIVLKLFNLINLTWVQVFIPTFISFGIIVIALLIFLIIISRD